MSNVAYHGGALVVECGADLAGLLGDEVGVRLDVRLSSEVNDLESLDVNKAAPGSPDHVFSQQNTGLLIVVAKKKTRMNGEPSHGRITKCKVLVYLKHHF